MKCDLRRDAGALSQQGADDHCLLMACTIDEARLSCTQCWMSPNPLRLTSPRCLLRQAALLLRRFAAAEDHPHTAGEAQMGLNTLRAVEVLSDDSNFRQGVMEALAGPLAAALLLDPPRFRSAWCAGEPRRPLH